MPVRPTQDASKARLLDGVVPGQSCVDVCFFDGAPVRPGAKYCFGFLRADAGHAFVPICCVAGEDLCQEIPVGISSLISSSSSDMGRYRRPGMVFMSLSSDTMVTLPSLPGFEAMMPMTSSASSIGLDAVE